MAGKRRGEGPFSPQFPSVLFLRIRAFSILRTRVSRSLDQVKEGAKVYRSGVGGGATGL